MPSLAETADRINRLTEGFLVPLYSEVTEQGGQRNLLSEDDFNRVVAGYACSECLAKFTMYLSECPVCHHKRDAERDIEVQAPQLWVDHVARLKALADGQDVMPPITPKGIDEFIKEVRDDPDIEQINL